jgi:hypothetical protein
MHAATATRGHGDPWWQRGPPSSSTRPYSGTFAATCIRQTRGKTGCNRIVSQTSGSCYGCFAPARRAVSRRLTCGAGARPQNLPSAAAQRVGTSRSGRPVQLLVIQLLSRRARALRALGLLVASFFTLELCSSPQTIRAQDAAARAQAVPSAPPALAAPTAPLLDPWILHSKDGRFSLRIGAQIQLRYAASDADRKPDRNGFKVQQVRPQIRATIGKPWIQVFIQPELANVPQLLDLELTLEPWKAFGVKLGQFLTPFSRTFLTPVPKLLFQDFSVANNFFRSDRDTGGMLYGTPWAGVFEYYLGVFNGNRINQNGNDDDQLLGIARLAVNPLGAVAYDETPALAGPQPWRFGIGVNGYYGKVPPGQVAATPAPAFPLPSGTTPALTPNAPAPRDLTRTIGADLVLHGWLATLQVEAYYRDLDPGGAGPRLRSKGGYAHASVFLFWPYVELAGRVSYLDVQTLSADASRVSRQLAAYEASLNGYAFGNNLKLELRYSYFDNPPAPAGQQPATHQFLAQTQWYF